MFKGFSAGALMMMLAACGAFEGRHASPPKPGESASTPALPASGTIYRIEESRSELRVLVYRAGPLARFGHNHVMVNRALSGTVNLGAAAVLRLTVPVARFVVDDAQARSAEGPDFAGEVSEDAKSGTLRNMLSAAVLGVDKFPEITVDGVAASGTQGASGAGALVARLAINVAGHESKIDVPFTLERDAHHLSAAGTLELRQSALGLIPYSLMLGALQVQDTMTIKFKIVAVLG